MKTIIAIILGAMSFSSVANAVSLECNVKGTNDKAVINNTPERFTYETEKSMGDSGTLQYVETEEGYVQGSVVIGDMIKKVFVRELLNDGRPRFKILITDYEGNKIKYEFEDCDLK
ncbi:TPA: hypothetical protein MM329_000688 [Escherichia coli]|nr:hypothetical protein [Escherichia coli]HBZ8229054.1 hypothetical protein [Escherichia coli]HBZ8345782.1 hypothetical protein [Escherichia coli]HBZ8350851.1 hypothetical protein [Escherichia coli]HBZ8356183.1 hypothetical protein [Escherichia coli]